jgi:hypothetical protein
LLGQRLITRLDLGLARLDLEQQLLQLLQHCSSILSLDQLPRRRLPEGRGGEVPFYVRPDGIPPGASVEAFRRHTLREPEVSARKWATSKTYEEVLAEWLAYCEAIAGPVLNGVPVRSDKVVWDATVSVSKAEEFLVESLCLRVKKTGSGA